MGPDERRAHGSRRGVIRLSFGLYCVSGTTVQSARFYWRGARGSHIENAPSRQLHRGQVSHAQSSNASFMSRALKKVKSVP